MKTLLFAYYDANKYTDKVHADDDGEPLCGTAYLLDAGEFLSSDRKYDRNILENFYGLNPEEVTCKRCLRKLSLKISV